MRSTRTASTRPASTKPAFPIQSAFHPRVPPPLTRFRDPASARHRTHRRCLRSAGFQHAFTNPGFHPTSLGLRFVAGYSPAVRPPHAARRLLQSISVSEHNCRTFQAPTPLTTVSHDDRRFRVTMLLSKHRQSKLPSPEARSAIASELPTPRSLTARLRPSSFHLGHPLSQTCRNEWPE